MSSLGHKKKRVCGGDGEARRGGALRCAYAVCEHAVGARRMRTLCENACEHAMCKVAPLTC